MLGGYFMIKTHRFILATMLTITIFGCGRNGEEVQLQEGDIDPSTQVSSKTRPRLMIVRNSQGKEVNISIDCTQKTAQSMKLTEAQATQSSVVDQIIESCRADRESNRGAYGYSSWGLGIYFGYGYNTSQNYCGLFYGSYGANWKSSCGNNYYYPSYYGNYNYNYNNTNNYNYNNCAYTYTPITTGGYSYYYQYWGGVPSYCYRNYQTQAGVGGGSTTSGYGYYY